MTCCSFHTDITEWVRSCDIFKLSVGILRRKLYDFGLENVRTIKRKNENSLHVFSAPLLKCFRCLCISLLSNISFVYLTTQNICKYAFLMTLYAVLVHNRYSSVRRDVLLNAFPLLVMRQTFQCTLIVETKSHSRFL